MSGESSKRPWDHKGSERIIQSGELGGDNETTRSGSNHNVGCQKTMRKQCFMFRIQENEFRTGLSSNLVPWIDRFDQHGMQ